MADLVALAFDLGDKYRRPVIVLADGLLGQMMEPVILPEPIDEASLPEKPWALSGHQGQRPHNAINSLHLVAQNLEDAVVERFERYKTVKENEQMAECYMTEDAEVIGVAYGAASRILRSAINKVRSEGIKAGMIRPITLWPFPVKVVEEHVEKARTFISVELSMGQMVEDVRLAVNGRKPVNFFGHTGGIVPTPDEVAHVLRRVNAGEELDYVPIHSKSEGRL
jgi:2-oxoglutarate ferredoxin oxidoreductase subunit alpha